MSDADFFSGRVQHIYFYGPVTSESVLSLKQAVREANRDVVEPPLSPLPPLPASKGAKAPGGAPPPPADPVFRAPLPIVVHVNSRGGSVSASITMSSVFAESRLPVCVLVDGMSASAATVLSMLAPYRVLTPDSICLVHEWSMDGKPSEMRTRRSDWSFFLETAAITDAQMKKLLLQRSRVTGEELEKLQQRDLLLDAPTCVRLGFADRILFRRPLSKSVAAKSKSRARGTPSSGSEIRDLLRRREVNHVTLGSTMGPSERAADEESPEPPGAPILELDRILATPGPLPIVLHFSAGTYTDDALDLSRLSGLFLLNSPLVARLRAAAAAGVDVIGVVDTVVDLTSVLPMLHCKTRVMYESASVVMHLVYRVFRYSMMQDIVDNTTTTLEAVKRTLRERTRLPKDMIDNLHRTRVTLDARQCLEYGLVDHIL